MSPTAEDVLKKQLYNLSWQGKYWGKKGAIAVSKLLSQHHTALGNHHPLSGLSSTYYSAAGNAVAHAMQASPVMKLFWFGRAYFALQTAGKLSDQLEKEVGIKNLNHDELDIRSSILRKLRLYEESHICSVEALSREGISVDSRVLLTIGLAETLDQIGRRNEAFVNFINARALIVDVKPTTSVRYYRSLAQHYKCMKNQESASENLKRALEIAEANNLGDQIEKIRATMKS